MNPESLLGFEHLFADQARKFLLRPAFSLVGDVHRLLREAHDVLFRKLCGFSLFGVWCWQTFGNSEKVTHSRLSRETINFLHPFFSHHYYLTRKDIMARKATGDINIKSYFFCTKI
jgi:hypothetical protein